MSNNENINRNCLDDPKVAAKETFECNVETETSLNADEKGCESLSRNFTGYSVKTHSTRDIDSDCNSQGHDNLQCQVLQENITDSLTADINQANIDHATARHEENIEVDEDDVTGLQATINLDINLNINLNININQEKSSQPTVEDIETDQEQSCASARSGEGDPSNEQELSVSKQSNLSSAVYERCEENIEVDVDVVSTNGAASTPPVDENSSLSEKSNWADARIERKEEVENIEIDEKSDNTSTPKNPNKPAVDENSSVSEESNLTDGRLEGKEEIENIEVDEKSDDTSTPKNVSKLPADENSSVSRESNLTDSRLERKAEVEKIKGVENADHSSTAKNASKPALDENSSVSEKNNLTDSGLERKEETEDIEVDRNVDDPSEAGETGELSSDQTVTDIARTDREEISGSTCSNVVLPPVEDDITVADPNIQKEDTDNSVSARPEGTGTECTDSIIAVSDVEKAVADPAEGETVSQFSLTEECLERDSYSLGKSIAAGDHCTWSESENEEGSVSPKEDCKTSDMGGSISRKTKTSPRRKSSPEYHEASSMPSSDDEHDRPWRINLQQTKKGKEKRPFPQIRPWSDRDTKMYREHYPNKKDIPKLDLNWRFYSGKVSSSPHGGYIDEIHEKWWGDYDRLEQHHGYIQWLFPIRESGMNWEAQELQLHEAKKIKEDKQASARFLISYKMMLDFYGMKLADPTTGCIERSKNWKERFCHLNSSMHNYLRITRILKCLGEMGLEHFKKPFLQFVLHEALCKNTLAYTLDSCLNYWVGTLRSDEEREEVEQYIKELGDQPCSCVRPMDSNLGEDYE